MAGLLNGAIINSDSIQVYKNLNILSAMPSFEDQKNIDHYLYGFQKINESFSVGKWLELLHKTLDEIKNKNKIGILVGGTGLYIQAATNGISPIPDIEEKVKKEGKELLQKLGFNNFKRLVERIDPNYINKNYDTQRLLRSYNVFFFYRQNIKSMA